MILAKGPIHWTTLLVVSLVTQVFGQTRIEGFDGGSVNLPCNLTANGDLTWKTGTTLILVKPTSGVVTIGNGLYKGDVSLVNNHELRITPLRRNRDGNNGGGDKTFQCEYSGGGKKQVQLVLLARIISVGIKKAIGHVEDTLTVTAGTLTPLTCIVGGDPNPPPSYSWSVDDVIINGQTSNLYTVTPDKSMKTIKCTATNNYRDGSVLSEMEVTTTLNVQYFERRSTQSSYTATENEQVTLQCSAEGNPPPNYQWNKLGNSVITSVSADYTIEEVQRSAAGQYLCHVNNSAGSHESTVNLTIQYPPDVTVSYSNTTQTLTCTADGVPRNYNFSQWEHQLDGKLLQTLGTQSSGSTATLKLPGTLTYEDTGYYVCQVSNSINSPQRGQLLVTPQTGAVFEEKKSAVLILGKTDVISVPFYTFSDTPNVTVVWKKAGESTVLTSHREETGPVRLMIHGQRVSMEGSVTVLTVKDVTQFDEGNYTVTVTNNINGVAESNHISLSVSVSLVTDAESQLNVGVIVGGVAGAVLFVIIVIVIIVVICRRSAKPADKVDQEENGSVKEHLVGSPGAFTDSRWKQPDAEIAINDLHESASFSRVLPPQDKRPPKPQRSFTHRIKPDYIPPPRASSQDLEMVNKSADPNTVKNGVPIKKKRGNGKPAKPLPPYDDTDTYENQPASFRAQNNNRLTEKPALNYEQVEFDKRKGQARAHPRESPVQYADINFPKRK